MMIKMTTVLLLTFSTMAAHAQFGKEWLTCHTDDDCIKVAGLCGRKDSINKKFTKDFDAFVEKMSKVSNCMVLTDKEKTHNEIALPKCVTDQCKLQDPEKK